MHPEFNAQNSEPFASREKLIDQHTLANPGLAADVFNVWWQKTAAENTAVVTEASALMRAHRLASTARRPRARQAH
jgi:hypothetical protein